MAKIESLETYEMLAAEIDRIVASPYPTQLKALRDILSSECMHQDISKWAASRPCQIAPLVSCTLHGLRQWPYVLDIVTGLASNPTLRNAFLHAEPTLLSDVISRAVQTDAVESEYTRTAVAMLSRPLPQSFALPANCQTLLVRLFEHASRQPSVDTIRPIYQLLQGVSTQLLGVLSSNVLLRFEDHLFSIVRNLRGDDQSLSLYCLAIMKTLATASNESFSTVSVSSYDTQELLASTQHSPTPQWKPDAVQQYFTARKAQKTMQLVVLRVMWACTPSTQESLEEKLESLVLASEILAAVPPDERDTWRKANPLVPKKLEEKVLSQALAPTLRFYALCFLLRLAEGSVVSPSVFDGIRRILLNTNDIAKVLAAGHFDPMDAIVRSGTFDASTITTLVQNTVDFVTSTDWQRVATERDLHVNILQHLSQGLNSEQSIVEGIMLALDVLMCGSKMHILGHLIQPPSNNILQTKTALCEHAASTSRASLIHELTRLFLKASLISSNSAYSLPQDGLFQLLDLHASSAQASMQNCRHSYSTSLSTSSLALVEVQSTPIDSEGTWRDALASELVAQSAANQQRLQQLFVKACSDLEDRCTNVEEPLREEIQKRQELQKEYKIVEQAHSKLKEEGIDRNVRFNALEMERDQFLTELDAARAEIESLESSILDKQRKLESSERRMRSNAEESNRALESAELSHAAALAGKEEDLEDLRAKVQDLESQLANAVAATETVRRQLDASACTLEQLRREVKQLEQTASERQTSIENLEVGRKDASYQAEQLKAQLSTVERERSEQHITHDAEMARIKEEAAAELVRLEDEHAKRLSEMCDQHGEAVGALKLELSGLESKGLEQQEFHGHELQRRDQKIHEYRKKLAHLRAEYEQKDKELAKMRDNVAALARCMQIPESEAKPAHQRSSRVSAAPSHDDYDSQNDPSPPTPCSGDGLQPSQVHPDTSFVSNISSNESRNEPTPKRARPRKSFKVPSPAKPLLRIGGSAPQTARKSLRSQSEVKRQPLGSMSVNSSPGKVGASKTPAGKGPVDVEVEMEDESTFDGSEVFHGTQAVRMLDFDR